MLIENNFKVKYIDCICCSFSHVIRLMYDTHYPNQMYVELVRNPYANILQKIYISFQYIFNIHRIVFLDKLLKINTSYTEDFDSYWSVKNCKEVNDFLQEFLEEHIKYLEDDTRTKFNKDEFNKMIDEL